MKKETIRFSMVFPSLTEEQLNLAIQGNLIVYNGNDRLRLKLDEKDLLVFEQAKKYGFIKQKRIDKQGSWKNTTLVYFFWCEIHCRTFIVIKEQSNFSDIQVMPSTATNYGMIPIPEDIPEMIGELALKYGDPLKSSSEDIVHVPNINLESIIQQLLKITTNIELSSIYLENEIQRIAPDVLKKKALSANPMPDKKKSETFVYSRDRFVAAYAKKRADGVCQLCNSPAPFMDLNGNPYLETHHIVWLSKGGKDTVENTVALCPNCHRKMHALDSPDDIKYLEQKISSEDSAEKII